MRDRAAEFAQAMAGPKLFYDYTASKVYCTAIGLTWLGDDWVRAADEEAHKLQFSQEQVDAAMRHHLWQVRRLFDPKFYGWRRIFIAWHFLCGKMPPVLVDESVAQKVDTTV